MIRESEISYTQLGRFVTLLIQIAKWNRTAGSASAREYRSKRPPVFGQYWFFEADCIGPVARRDPGVPYLLSEVKAQLATYTFAKRPGYCKPGEASQDEATRQHEQFHDNLFWQSIKPIYR